MKKGIVCLLITFSYFIPYAQNVGIGTNTPKARLHVSDSSVVFTGGLAFLPGPFGDPPITGPGVRMMWYADKAAFRAGAVSSNYWDKDSIGNYSFATGFNNRATNNYSTSIGRLTIASGITSTSMGYRTTASGGISTSMGQETTASGAFSTSMGMRTTANGQGSVSMGFETNAWGDYSTTMGYKTATGGAYSTSMGYQTYATGNASTSMGSGTDTRAFASLAIGTYNDNNNNPDPVSPGSSDRIFQIGNGTSENGRSNALTVLRNGNIGIGTVTPSALLSFANSFGTKISLYQGYYGDVGIGVYDYELRLQNGMHGGKVSMGVIDTTGAYVESARAVNNGTIAFIVNGSLLVNSTLYSSDERFKQNIVAIASPLQKILQINGVEYEMRVGEFPQKHFIPGRQIGLIAQNVEKIIPDVVHEMDGYKALDYAKLVPLLIEGIKEQQKEIDELKKWVEQLLKK
ncbi:MAG: hypothetical protein E6H07_11880 [Bacteroidetes bacterium]|nr:MAG: hypothetical protein E6H07_11880 [Bacteroidota bacterium]